MKNHSCPPGCTNGLSQICGTSLDLDDLNFAESKNHLLYVNKVYSKGEGVASPLVFNLNTSPATFQTQLLLSPLRSQETDNLCEEVLGAECNCRRDRNRDSIFDSNGNWGCDRDPNRREGINCNCNCNCGNVLGAATCQLDENAVFTILRSRVRVTSFNLEHPGCLSPNQVTVDGFPVDSLFNFDGSYEASVDSILPDIIKKPCAENNLPTKAFFLISCAGPWIFQAEFIVEGTVNTNGTICCFRATFSTFCPTPICANIPVVNLSVPKISIPCASGGMTPRIVFNFGANMNLLNPILRLIPDSDNDALRLVLDTAVAVEPTVDVQVLKQALLCINACEAIFPCEGTDSELESEEEEEEELEQECQCGNGNQTAGASNRPSNCSCRSRNSSRNPSVLGANTSCSSCFRGF
ncbi:hypothetical protein Ami103574_12730 [Aminipila butyrica]|uniref:Uncharacterized protein n=1 Tax=Aminipila butyrica TaxID=433296 RepID=A0A858BZE7_9FIRM|nr:hypothetical protein [Aminipila butyrica]QIB70104.1 hypothetical protein Ami103574_12730 [Aminipila butyrica]